MRKSHRLAIGIGGFTVSAVLLMFPFKHGAMVSNVSFYVGLCCLYFGILRPLVQATNARIGIALITGIGFAMLAYYGGTEYESNQLDKYGGWTHGVVTSLSMGAPLHTDDGKRAYYQYVFNGENYSAWVETDSLQVGDTIPIKASSQDPIVHEVYSKSGAFIRRW